MTPRHYPPPKKVEPPTPPPPPPPRPSKPTLKVEKKDNPPAEVMALAEKVGMTPLSWFIAPDHITIVFVEGAKLRFERE